MMVITSAENSACNMSFDQHLLLLHASSMCPYPPAIDTAHTQATNILEVLLCMYMKLLLLLSPCYYFVAVLASPIKPFNMLQHAVSIGEAAVDQVMGLASAALKEAQVAFAACVAAQPAMLSDIISRLRSLLLSSARLSEGELLRRTDDLGPTTAQTAPHRVWRWDLSADEVALGTGPGRTCAA